MLQYADLSYLESMSGGSNEIVVEMIDIFLDQVPEFIDEMKSHLDNKAYEDLGKIAHKAKSSMAVMGLNELCDDLKNLELLAKEGKETEKYPALVEKFVEVSQAAAAELRDHKEKL